MNYLFLFMQLSLIYAPLAPTGTPNAWQFVSLRHTYEAMPIPPRVVPVGWHISMESEWVTTNNMLELGVVEFRLPVDLPESADTSASEFVMEMAASHDFQVFINDQLVISEILTRPGQFENYTLAGDGFHTGENQLRVLVSAPTQGKAQIVAINVHHASLRYRPFRTLREGRQYQQRAAATRNLY